MPMQRRILSSSGLVLLAGLLSPARGQTVVKAAPNSEEVKSSHGRTWVALPDPLFTIRMDKDGKVTGTAVPIGVAHEELGEAYCAAVRSAAAVSINGSAIVTFTPAPRCSFSASDAMLVLPLDSIRKVAAHCNQPSLGATASESGCRGNPQTGELMCPPGAIGAAWRRAEGWTGRVAYNGSLHVDLVYDRWGLEHAKDVGEVGVHLTCDKVPCMTWLPPVKETYRMLPDAFSGRPYRVQLFSGATPPITLDTVTAPPGLTVTPDGYVSGTPTLLGPQSLKVAFTESYACPWNAWTLAKGVNSHWSSVFHLTVRDGEAPKVVAFKTSPDTLPAGGGNVAVTLEASDNVRPEKAFSSRVGPNANHTSAMTPYSAAFPSRTFTITWPIPKNTTSSPVVYTIKAWAVDSENNSVTATPRTVVVQGAGELLPHITIPRP